MADSKYDKTLIGPLYCLHRFNAPLRPIVQSFRGLGSDMQNSGGARPFLPAIFLSVRCGTPMTEKMRQNVGGADRGIYAASTFAR
jgi:hypothetical protein